MLVELQKKTKNGTPRVCIWHTFGWILDLSIEFEHLGQAVNAAYVLARLLGCNVIETEYPHTLLDGPFEV